MGIRTLNTSHWKQPIIHSNEIKSLTEVELQKGVLRNGLHRLYEETDFDVLVSYLMENWRLGYKKAKISHRLAAEIYAHYTLAESQIMIVEKLNTSGFASYQCALISDETESQKYHRTKFEELLFDYPSIRPYYEAEGEIENFQKEKSNNYLQMLIVGKKFQGQYHGWSLFSYIKNIEHQLWYKNQENPKADFLKEISVYTTTECNVRFYEKQGGEILYKKSSIPDKKRTAEAMIYQFPVTKYSWN